MSSILLHTRHRFDRCGVDALKAVLDVIVYYLRGELERIQFIRLKIYVLLFVITVYLVIFRDSLRVSKFYKSFRRFVRSLRSSELVRVKPIYTYLYMIFSYVALSVYA